MKNQSFLFIATIPFIALGAYCIPSINDQRGQVDTQQLGSVKEVACQLAVQNDDFYFYTSADGLQFTKQQFIQSRSSVPNLYYDPTQNNYLLTFQSFENSSALCDKLAYTRLSLTGEVLESTQPIQVDSDKYFTGFDPTIVSINSKLVLVYTVRPQGKKYPCISIAVAKGSDISNGFTNLDQIIWCSDTDSENFMDPAAAVIEESGHPYLYLYIPSDKSMASSTPVNYFAKIDVSAENPNDWIMNSTGTINDAGLFLLGEMVTDLKNTNCPYAFYGTVQNTINRGCSTDGLTFIQPPQPIFSGADPAVTIAPDGSFVLVYASDN